MINKKLITNNSYIITNNSFYALDRSEPLITIIDNSIILNDLFITDVKYADVIIKILNNRNFI